MKEAYLVDSPLGKTTDYNFYYDKSLLFAVPRNMQREKIAILDKLPFSGGDIWNAYEISWLNPKGKPQIAIGEIFNPCESKYITESKSLKLYLNSFYQSTFENAEGVRKTIEKDISELVCHSGVQVKLTLPENYSTLTLGSMPGICLDTLDIETSQYKVNPDFLLCEDEIVQEKLYSDLLKSNCLGTRQPDWASVYIHYKGPKIIRENLLKYIISFREHNEFGEHCVERIFTDLMQRCKPEKLTVFARYTRRGGIDLNPFRSNFEAPMQNIREYRQ